MHKIFISGPYSQGDVEANVKRAMSIANDLIELGYAPYCPHLTHFLNENKWQPYEKWLEIDNAFLVLCDAILRIEGDSVGAEKEVNLAQKIGIPVFYALDELDRYFKSDNRGIKTQ